MQVTPLPGTSRDNLLDQLRELERRLGLHVETVAQLRAGEYLDWATGAAEVLGHLVSAEDVSRLVLTPGYDRLLGAMALRGGDVRTQRVLNGMINAEEQQRQRVLAAAAKELEAQAQRWGVPGELVVPDTGFFIEGDKLEDADLNDLLDTTVPVHVVVPIAVIDQLDGLKQASDRHTRWRAGYTLAVVDRVLARPERRGVLQPGRPLAMGENGAPVPSRGAVTLEILFDPPGHVRLPITDDEIIGRALVLEALAARKVTLVTYDTGQSTRGRMAGLNVIKLSKDPGPEPEPARPKVPAHTAPAG